MTEKPWNMARVASRRPLPRAIKMHGSVVGGLPVAEYQVARMDACVDCGYHVCSCPELDPIPPPMALEDTKKLLDSISGQGFFIPKPSPFSKFPCCGQPSNRGGHAHDCNYGRLKQEATACMTPGALKAAVEIKSEAACADLREAILTGDFSRYVTNAKLPSRHECCGKDVDYGATNGGHATDCPILHTRYPL